MVAASLSVHTRLRKTIFPYIVQHGGPDVCFTRVTVHIFASVSPCRVGSDDFLVIHTRDDLAALHGTTPYTHSSPGTPINMPWLGGVQTGRGASVVSSAAIFVCYDIGLAICFPRTSSPGLFSTSLVPCELVFICFYLPLKLPILPNTWSLVFPSGQLCKGGWEPAYSTVYIIHFHFGKGHNEGL